MQLAVVNACAMVHPAWSTCTVQLYRLEELAEPVQHVQQLKLLIGESELTTP